jgi:hypothetical protein
MFWQQRRTTMPMDMMPDEPTTEAGEKMQEISYKRRAPSRRSFPLPPRSSDPVPSYLNNSAWIYGFGYLPDGSPAESGEKVYDDLVERTRNLVNQLFGTTKAANQYLSVVMPEWKHPVRESLRKWTQPKRQRTSGNIGRLRTLNLHLLTHVGTLREHLMDIERELWVNLQISHDPRLSSTGSSARAQQRRRKLYARAKIEAKKKRLPPPKPNHTPVVLPARILAMLNDPGKVVT